MLTLVILMMIASSQESYAQSSNDIALNIPALLAAIPSESAKSEREVRETEVNVRAMRNFTRSYKNIPGVKWFTSQSGHFASFVSNGTHTKVVYDIKGNRAYAITSYTEAKLDRNVRTLVKSTYFDSNIIGVHEFEFDNKTIYVIKLQDSRSNFATLKVSEGQIEDITSHAKK